jgi:hypothetical protein
VRRGSSTAATTYHRVLKILYNWLAEEEEIPADPMATIKPIVLEQPVGDRVRGGPQAALPDLRSSRLGTTARGGEPTGT